MYIDSIHMIDEADGWGVGVINEAKDFMRDPPEWTLFHTANGGSHWEAIKTSNDLHITPFFLSGSTAWVAINHHLAHTHTAGSSWIESTLAFAPGESAQITQLTFVDAHTGWLIANISTASAPPKSGSLPVLYHTNDGGTHWHHLLNLYGENCLFPTWGKKITFLTATTGWITSASLLFITSDGGHTWQPQTLPLPAGIASFSNFSLQAPHFFSDQDGILSACRNDFSGNTANGFVVFVTHDGGQSWQSQPFVPQNYNQLYEKKQRVAFEKLKEMKHGEPSFWFASDLMYRSTPAPRLTDMHFGWVGHPSLGMLITSDGGEHWEELELHNVPEGIEQIQFVNRNVGWGFNRGRDVGLSQWYKTVDGGKTWTLLKSSIK